jgi:hypothetical protein
VPAPFLVSFKEVLRLLNGGESAEFKDLPSLRVNAIYTEAVFYFKGKRLAGADGCEYATALADCSVWLDFIKPWFSFPTFNLSPKCSEGGVSRPRVELIVPGSCSRDF